MVLPTHFFKILKIDVGMLNGPHALVKFKDIIIFSISVRLTDDKKKLDA